MPANATSSPLRRIQIQCLLALILAAICLFAPLASLSSLFNAAILRFMSAFSLVTCYYRFTQWMLLSHQEKQNRRTKDLDLLHTSGRNDAAESTQYLIIFASQTGYAEQLAQQTSNSLQQAGANVRLLDIAQVHASDLTKLPTQTKMLWIVSTTGEGDAPDSAASLWGQLLAQPIDLASLQYAVLALGDRHYQAFCAFGHQLDQQLHKLGAQRLFDVLEVDNGDDGTLRHWQQQLGHLTGNTTLPDWLPAEYETWTLSSRQLINAGSAGHAVYLIRLTPPGNGSQHTWQAGDILEISPRRPNDDSVQPHREYSIASIMQDGAVELVVRQAFQADGTVGLGSGWLNLYAEVGETIAARLRSNRSFHSPQLGIPLILIGNGTGIAGLRAHIKQRQHDKQLQNWLIYGERNRITDFLFEDEITAWQNLGVLQRLDLAFSRDQEQRLYVQHQLQAAASELRAWIENGAAIYVCGSLQGMAAEVDATLRLILGDTRIEQLREQGLYRRDVY